MARRIPKYPTKPDSRNRVRVKFRGKSYTLPGELGSKESVAEYARLLAEWTHDTAPRLAAAGVTISELVAMYLKADPRGMDHPQVKRIARACQPLERLFGPTYATDFTAKRLGAVQEAMINQTWMTDEEKERRGQWGADHINACRKWIRAIFKWAEYQGHVASGTRVNLLCCPPVAANHPHVKRSRPREPVDYDKQVVPILPHVSPAIAAMIQIQYLAGMRPSEVLNMTRGEVSRNEIPDVWLYRPSEFKTMAHGVELVKALGPRCQELLAPWLLLAGDDNAPLFPSPHKRRPYTPEGYSASIARACRKAGVKHFCPYQLRHAARLRVTRSHGLDAARSHLGHAGVAMTTEYAKQIDIETAARVARECG